MARYRKGQRLAPKRATDRQVLRERMELNAAQDPRLSPAPSALGDLQSST
jgi:hypothetical protein